MDEAADVVVRDVVCIGASSGGVSALMRLVGQLPPSLPAAVFIVLHTSPGSPGTLASILSRATPLPTALAIHDEPIQPGRIRVAPPDHHLVLSHGRALLDRGPTENRVRPAVDTLFRSAAVACGARVIGIVLTGHLSDGSAGVCAIKRAGGTVIVQSPADAECPSMPRAAIAADSPDHVVPLAEMGALLGRIVGTKARRAVAPEELALEVDAGMRLGDVSVQINDQLGRSAPFTCPDCGGPLWRLAKPPRFRCQLGHAFNDDVLADAQAQTSVQALWVAARTLDERARLLGEMARAQRDMSRGLSAAAYETRAREVREAADEIRRLMSAMPNSLEVLPEPSDP